MVVALSSRRQLFLFAASFSVLILLVVTFSSSALLPRRFDRLTERRAENRYASVGVRKLLHQGARANGTSSSLTTKPSRIGEGCSTDDIVLYQAPTAPLPNGIPTYTVQILNECLVDGCRIGRIHLSCGWFSSARLVNPRVFRRLRHNDCLVNDGRPIAAGQSLSFQYANTYKYPLSVSSAICI